MRTSPPDLPGSSTTDSPVDRALALLLAGEKEAALRWSAAVVAQEDAMPSALILTCRLLADLGRTEAAIEGFRLGLAKSIDSGNLPLAVAAVADLRVLGIDIDGALDDIASAFCAGSPRLTETPPPPPPLPAFAEFQPLSSFLTGPALLSKATQIVHEASRKSRDNEGDPPPIAPLPLFSALEKEALRALIPAFEMITVPAGKEVIVEGAEGAEAYIVARGELEVRRRAHDGDGEGPITLARLTNGALFGEMALLSRAPRAGSVVACRPSILLVARREALELVAEKRPDVGAELAAHCRRRMVANLVRTSPVLRNVPPLERPALVERFETKTFEKGERLITTGEDPDGLHLIASGEVSVVGYEGTEPFVIASLVVGDVVGEVALVLRRIASADVVAVCPTVTLHLPRGDFMDLIREHPAILQSLYLLAIERDEETSSVMATSTVTLTDDYVLV
jgi:cAMP-dependent protein kinase regulator